MLFINCRRKNHDMLLAKVVVVLGLLAASGSVELFLSTDEDGTVPIDFRTNLDRINSDFPIKILIHGWTETYNTSEYVSMAEQYAKKGHYNVIRVDYSDVSKLDIFSAMMHLESVGEYIGRFVTMLHGERNVSLANVHLIGHSLGGQVCGFAGRTVFRLTGSKLGRITALDPARPAYESNFVPESGKLTRKNAEMVDIIHTDGGQLGYERPAGSLDFYPNGGRKLQPKCTYNLGALNNSALLHSIWNSYLFSDGNDSITYTGRRIQVFIVPKGFCSHIKSKRYFLMSINGKYMATKCGNWDDFSGGKCKGNEQIPFGEDAPRTTEGIYFLNIQDE